MKYDVTNTMDFLHEARRMCKAQKDCTVCLMYDGMRDDCMMNDFQDVKGWETVVEKLQQWSDEHPEKTMMDDFFEKFPNAPHKSLGRPEICPYSCGYEKNHYCDHAQGVPDCFKCWSRPLPEKEGEAK